MTTDPQNPLAGKSPAFKAAIQAVEDMGAAAAALRAKSKAKPGDGKKAPLTDKAAPIAETTHEKDGNAG